VPENPTQCFTSAKSHADAVIEDLYCLRFDGKTQRLSQNEIVFLFLLKIVYKPSITTLELILI